MPAGFSITGCDPPQRQREGRVAGRGGGSREEKAGCGDGGGSGGIECGSVPFVTLCVNLDLINNQNKKVHSSSSHFPGNSLEFTFFPTIFFSHFFLYVALPYIFVSNCLQNKSYSWSYSFFANGAVHMKYLFRGLIRLRHACQDSLGCAMECTRRTKRNYFDDIYDPVAGSLKVQSFYSGRHHG